MIGIDGKIDQKSYRKVRHGVCEGAAVTSWTWLKSSSADSMPWLLVNPLNRSPMSSSLIIHLTYPRPLTSKQSIRPRHSVLDKVSGVWVIRGAAPDDLLTEFPYGRIDLDGLARKQLIPPSSSRRRTIRWFPVGNRGKMATGSESWIWPGWAIVLEPSESGEHAALVSVYDRSATLRKIIFVSRFTAMELWHGPLSSFNVFSLSCSVTLGYDFSKLGILLWERRWRQPRQCYVPQLYNVFRFCHKTALGMKSKLGISFPIVCHSNIASSSPIWGENDRKWDLSSKSLHWQIVNGRFYKFLKDKQL
jgi:hypothetical protein